MEILRPGLISTIQDLGRFGYQASGFAPTGACDSLSMRRANALVGNDPGEAVLEMMLLGITAKFRTACVIALTGADMTPKINHTNSPYIVKKSSTQRSSALLPEYCC